MYEEFAAEVLCSVSKHSKIGYCIVDLKFILFLAFQDYFPQDLYCRRNVGRIYFITLAILVKCHLQCCNQVTQSDPDDPKCFIHLTDPKMAHFNYKYHLMQQVLQQAQHKTPKISPLHSSQAYCQKSTLGQLCSCYNRTHWVNQ